MLLSHLKTRCSINCRNVVSGEVMSASLAMTNLAFLFVLCKQQSGYLLGPLLRSAVTAFVGNSKKSSTSAEEVICHAH